MLGSEYLCDSDSDAWDDDWSDQSDETDGDGASTYEENSEEIEDEQIEAEDPEDEEHLDVNEDVDVIVLI